MNSLGPVLLLVYLVIAPGFVALVPGIRGILLSFIAGWLMLSPRAGYAISGLPELTKDVAVSYAALLGVVCFRANIIRSFRFRWIDAVFAMWIFSPFLSSISNGFGPWDGMSELFTRVFTWGVPYFLGRAAIRSLDDVRDAATTIVIAGLLAVPLCLIEIRLSPQLHRWVYGQHATGFAMAKRLGGYRPTLMMRHGIEVGMWMVTATAIASWTALSAPGQRVWMMPMRLVAGVLIVVSILCKSLGAIALLLMAGGVSVLGRSIKSRALLAAFVLIPTVYISLRATQVWSPESIGAFIAEHVDENRAKSMLARNADEAVLSEKALKRPVFGWGGRNNFRVFDDFGEQTTVVDALWLLAIGKNGLVGLFGLYATCALPSLLILRKTPVRLLVHRNMAPVVGLMLAVTMATIDSLMNAFFTPVMMVVIGVLATVNDKLPRWLPKPVRTPPTPPTHIRSPGGRPLPAGINPAGPPAPSYDSRGGSGVGSGVRSRADASAQARANATQERP